MSTPTKVGPHRGARLLFDEWTNGRSLPSLGTNDGASPIAFQTWHRFKDCWIIATDDGGLTRKAAELGIATCTSAEFVALLA